MRGEMKEDMKKAITMAREIMEEEGMSISSGDYLVALSIIATELFRIEKLTESTGSE